MRTVFALTGVFAIVASIISKTGFPEVDDYALWVPRPTNGTASHYDIVARGLGSRDCVNAFAHRDRQIYPASTAICARIFDPNRSSGLFLQENTNAKGQVLIEAYPFSANGP